MIVGGRKRIRNKDKGENKIQLRYITMEVGRNDRKLNFIRKIFFERESASRVSERGRERESLPSKLHAQRGVRCWPYPMALRS